MRWGICTSIEKSPAVLQAGWDFIEESVQGLLQGLKPDAEWDGLTRARQSSLPIYGANVLVPGSLKITGPTANLEDLHRYMSTVMRRAALVGIKRLVFGSGGARRVPDGFDPATARDQIIAFLRMTGPLAEQNGVILTIEHLNTGECNILTSVKEAMEYVRAVNHPAIRCLVDSYHFWLNGEELSTLRDAMPAIQHVHLADKDGRVAPGLSGLADYRPFFAVLKQGGYDQGISVEAGKFDIAKDAAGVLAYVKSQWAQA